VIEVLRLREREREREGQRKRVIWRDNVSERNKVTER
jgi:hypothetical protein